MATREERREKPIESPRRSAARAAHIGGVLEGARAGDAGGFSEHNRAKS